MSNVCPKDNLIANEQSERRRIKLTAKALACKIESIQKERQAKVNKLKGVVNLVKELMQNPNEHNAQSIQSHLDNVYVLFDDATKLHDAVIPLLPQEEQEKQNAWFANIHKHNALFNNDVNKWLSDVNGHAGSAPRLRR